MSRSSERLEALRCEAYSLAAEDDESADLAELAEALDHAALQIAQLAAGIGEVVSTGARRMEQVVQERTAAFAAANRNLQDSQRQRLQLLDRTVRAAEDERTRLAANLHDGPIQRLAALGLLLDRCRLRMERGDGPGSGELLVRARTALGTEITRLRQMMSELRPPVLDEGGLEAALRDQLSDWQTITGVRARLQAAPFQPVTPDAETVIYRVVQEALANVAKHAYASEVTVTLTPSGSGVEAVISDNGQGFPNRADGDMLRGGHFGLVVMRERVELADGRFEIRSTPRKGTEVAAWLPSAESVPEEAA